MNAPYTGFYEATLGALARLDENENLPVIEESKPDIKNGHEKRHPGVYFLHL